MVTFSRALWLLILLAPGALVSAEENKPADDPKERVAALVRKLDDENFENRQEATKQLIAAGRAALPAIREALQKTGISPEAKNGLRLAVNGLKRTFLTVSLKSDKAQYNLAEDIKVTCTMTNNGDEAIIVLPPLDGSELKERQPHYEFTVTREDEGKTTKVAARPGMKDDNFLNAFKPEDFIKVEPGKEVTFRTSFLNWWYGMDKTPGVYKVRLDYSFENTTAASGDLQPHGPDVDALMKQAWEGEASSKQIQVIVMPGEK